MDLLSAVVLIIFVSADVAFVAKTALIIYHKRLLGKGIAMAARFLSRMRGCRLPLVDGGDNQPMDEKQAQSRLIREQAKRALVERCVSCARVVNLCIGILIMLYRSPMYSGGTDSLLAGGVIASSLMSIVAMICFCIPATLNSRTLVYWNVVLMASICLQATPWSTSAVQGLILSRPSLHVIAIGLSFLCPKLNVLVVTNACLGVCILWLYQSGDAPLEGVSMSKIAQGEAGILVVKTMVHWRVYLTLQEVAEQDIRSRMGQCQRSAVSLLLGMMCDAVVDLDANLRMMDHEASLANLLMHGPGRSSKGMGIRELVAPGRDREIFDESIARNVRGVDGSPMPGMFGSRVRDSIGNHLKVVIYHVPYETIAGQMNHLMGLRESTDGDLPGEGGSEGQHRGAKLPEAVLVDEVSEQLVRSTCARRPSFNAAGSSVNGSTTSSVRSVPGENTWTADVLVKDGLPFQYATENLKSKLGLNPDAEHFLDTLPTGEREAFFLWVKDRAEQVRAGALVAPRIEVYGNVAFVSGGSQGGRVCHRKVRVCFPAVLAQDSTYAVSINLSRLPSGVVGSTTRGTPAHVAPPELPSGPRSAQPESPKLCL